MKEKSRENNADKGSILNGIIKYSISTWANLVIGFLSVIITTRILVPDVYGMVTIFISASNVLMYIVTLGMDGAFIRFYNDPPNGNTKSQLLYKNLLLSSIICIIVGTASTLIFGDSLSEYIFGIKSSFILGMLFLYTMCQVLLRYLNISFRMGFKVRQYNIQNILMNCLIRILMIVGAFVQNDYVFIICVITLGILCVLIFYLYMQRAEFIPFDANGDVIFRLSLKNYKAYFRYAVFSAPSYIVTYLNTFLAQQIIRSKLNAFSLGVFSSTGMFGTILSALKGGFATYWSAYVFKNYKKEQGRIKRMHDYVMVAAIIMCSGLVLFRDIIYLVIGQDYHSSKCFFSLLIIYPILNFILETTEKGIELEKKNEITLASHIIAALLNVILCIILIPLYGLNGAAWANAISGITLFTINTFYGQKYYESIISVKKSIIGICLILFMLTIPSFTEKIIIIAVLTIVIDMAAFFIYRMEVLRICTIIFKQINSVITTER